MSGFRLYGLLGGLLALAAFIGWVVRIDHLRASWKAKHEILSEKTSGVLVAIRTASGNPRLRLADAAGQVAALANSRASWKDAAELQSSRIDALGAETARLKGLNDALRARAEAAIAKRDSAIKRLETQALTPGERSDCARQLFDAEAALDLVYREGL